MKPSLALASNRDAVRRVVEAHRACNPRIFGSVAHGDDTEDSDLDILIDPTPETTLFDIGAIRHELLQLLGVPRERLAYVVPDRAVHGYGLTPAIVELALPLRPDLLVTVDNGIASLEGVAHARAHGMAVIVTDHHLPAQQDGRVVLPEAEVIVNPNQPGCGFASKNLAGVGVMFYVLLALRGELRERGAFTAEAQPRLDALLDLVALGTVADVVKLDANNRRLVAQGLRRIRAGRMQPGLAALFAAAGRDARRASAFDFGFALGPRINAAGRLADMTLGIECLLTDDAQRAAELAKTLDAINRERRELESGMREQAEALLDALMPQGEPPPALALFDPGFHEGVVGIVAARLKDRVHRPTFVFARGQDGALKGFGIGAGVTAASGAYTTLPNTDKTKGYAVFDAQASYETGPFKIGATVTNLLGATLAFICAQPPSPDDRAHKIRCIYAAPLSTDLAGQDVRRLSGEEGSDLNLQVCCSRLAARMASLP